MPEIETLAWTLPRPRMKPYYRGGFPLYFEENLLKLYGFTPRDQYTVNGRQLNLFAEDMVVHPFGGLAEYGIRVDVNPDLRPHVLADAHALPFKSDTFGMVIVDPPYSNKLSRSIYGTGKLKYYTYVSEAVRVTKPGGYIALYHVMLLPRPSGAAYDKRILIAHRLWHRPRVCNVFRKLYQSEIDERGL